MSSMLSLPTSWQDLQPFLRAFVQLSYPVERPKNPDSFPSWNYYGIGPLDVCFIISTMAVFAVLREIVRLHIMTPFANKILFGNSRGYQVNTLRANGSAPKQNGTSNGAANGHHNVHKISARNRVRERNVIRFAEQGWALVYYTIWWSFGLVCELLIFFRTLTAVPSMSIYPSPPHHGISTIYG